MSIGTVRPLRSPPDAEVVLPGSKSITNRYLLAAALSTGQSRLSGFLRADDTSAMIDCVSALGATVSFDSDGTTALVVGTHGHIATRGTAYARQSGTTARFIAPVLSTAQGPWTLDGDPQLRVRPMADLFRALRSLGATVSSTNDDQLPARLLGPITGGKVSVRGTETSQFLSGLLMCAPLLADGLLVELVGELVSRPYVEMTVSTLERFGVAVKTTDNGFEVPSGKYEPRELTIEPDASAASYLFAAAAITGGRVLVKGLGSQSIQGDMALLQVLDDMGATVTARDDRTEVTGTGQLRGISVDCRDFSDMVPTIAVVAAFAEGATNIFGVGFIRNKESDRIATVVSALKALGVDAIEHEDGLSISPAPMHGGTVVTHGDHRIAMALSLAGLIVDGVVVDDPMCVAKTFPGFFDTLQVLGS